MYRLRQHHHRHGLTLIELVLAAAGCSMLLVLIASLLTTQARWMTRCQQSVETTRASLRLSQWLREDLSRLPWLDADDGRMSSGTSISERVLQFEIQLADQPLQIYGSRDSLAISQWMASEEAGKAFGESRMICTVWSDASASRHAIPYLSNDQQVRFQPLPTSPTQTFSNTYASGVTRKQYQIGKQVTERQRTSFAEAAAFIRFRYFDGQRWQDQWNSYEQHGLPHAIEFTVQFGDNTPSQRFVHAISVGPAGDTAGAES